ncbi:MAG: GNAT family N-acetyltransferase [Lachnospiraceae bacterium]
MKIDRHCLEETKKQFYLDYNVENGRWIAENVCLSPHEIREGARLHARQDTFFKVGILLGKAYVMADEAMHPWIEKELVRQPPEWWCDFATLRKIDAELGRFGREILDTHIYFLPSQEVSVTEPEYDVCWYEGEDIEQFRGNELLQHALSFSPTQPDRIAVAAYDGSQLMGMAGVSEDGAHLWQIGIDIMKPYGGRGLGTHLVKLIKEEILHRGRVPYYGTSESHSLSRNVAVSGGFVPAWAEIVTHGKKV